MGSSTGYSSAATPLVATEECDSHPFSRNIVQLTQAEHIELKWNGNYWKRQHGYVKEQNAELKRELEWAHAKIRDLEQRLYGKKSEIRTTRRDTFADDCSVSSRSRGQQKGSPGHGRTPRPDVPVVEEERDAAPEDKKCRACGKAYDLLQHTEDSRIIEVQVKAHVRLIRRKMYTQACACEGVPGLITAPLAARLVPKTVVGISVWTEVLINKFLFSRATYNAQNIPIVVCP